MGAGSSSSSGGGGGVGGGGGGGSSGTDCPDNSHCGLKNNQASCHCNEGFRNEETSKDE